MRHSVLSVLSMNSPSNRARPACKLSLVVASASTTLGGSTDDVVAMEVDPPSQTASSTAGVPFPSSEKNSRKHPLLSCPLSKDISNSPGDPSFIPEHLQPRKRTRTSAILPPLKPYRSHRSNSASPPRNRRVSLPVGHATSPPSGRGQQQQHQANDTPFVDPFPTLHTTPVVVLSQSPLLNLIDDLVISAASEWSPATSLLPSASSRRRSFPGEMCILNNLYRSLLYGLGMKYSVIDPAHGARKTCLDYIVKSQLDIQDALLADKISCYLAAHGEDIMTVAVQVESIDGQNQQKDYDAVSFAQQDISNTLMSYQQIISSLFLHRRSSGRQRASRISNRIKTPTKLRTVFSMDSA